MKCTGWSPGIGNPKWGTVWPPPGRESSVRTPCSPGSTSRMDSGLTTVQPELGRSPVTNCTVCKSGGQEQRSPHGLIPGSVAGSNAISHSWGNMIRDSFLGVGSSTWASCFLGKYSTIWATLPAFFFLVGSTWVWIQNLELARQVLYHLSHCVSPFCVYVGYFQVGVLQTICPGWPLTSILLISASWVARITSISHQQLAFLFTCFLDRVLCFYLGLALDLNPPTYTFLVAGITSMNYHAWSQ
jgi:hypothetical protein